MVKNIKLDLEVVESMLYYWSCVSEKEKVSESFFNDVSNMTAMKLVKTDEFNDLGIKQALSAIQNRELLSAASLPVKRFWSKNMWIVEDPGLPLQMATPIKTLNLDDLVDKLNEKYPNNTVEEIVVHVTPLHVDEYYITDNNLIVNFFMMYLDFEENQFIAKKPVKEYIFEKLCELVEGK